MKKLFLILCLANPLSHAIEMEPNHGNNASQPRERVLGLRFLPEYRTVRAAGPCCEFCVTACICCSYITAGIPIAAYHMVMQRKTTVKPTSQHME